MPEINKEISYKSLTRMARSFGKPGQISTRKLSTETGWVGSVLYIERVEGSTELTQTTLIVKDKEFDQSYQARQYMEQRMKEIFAPASV